jgi:hypothetical protein
MQQSFGQRPIAAPAVLGLLLVALGVVVLVARQIGVDVPGAIGSWGWPLFIIIPGVVLLAVSLVPAPPNGIGFAVAGAVITTVGSLLLYQSQTQDWESWAYAWALIPMAVGAALVVYGLYAQRSKMVRGGLWTAGIATLLFAFGAWFFEGLYQGQMRPDINEWWPIAIVAVGAVLVLRAVLPAGQRADPDEPRDAA